MINPEDFGYEVVGKDPNASLVPAQDTQGRFLLSEHIDARGGLVELWRQSWDIGGPTAAGARGTIRQAYISETLPGVIKAFHLHKSQIDRFICLSGRVLVCAFDLANPSTGIRETVLDGRRPMRIDIPPGFAHGWMALGNEMSRILNLCSHEYDGSDEHRRSAHDGPCPGVSYDWRTSRDG